MAAREIGFAVAAAPDDADESARAIDHAAAAVAGAYDGGDLHRGVRGADGLRCAGNRAAHLPRDAVWAVAVGGEHAGGFLVVHGDRRDVRPFDQQGGQVVGAVAIDEASAVAAAIGEGDDDVGRGGLGAGDWGLVALIEQVRAGEHEAGGVVARDERAAAGGAVGDVDAAMGGWCCRLALGAEDGPARSSSQRAGASSPPTKTAAYSPAMSHQFPHQHLDPAFTTWHITFGTYGTRLHGSDRPTVDKKHNQLDEPFVPAKIERMDSARDRMKFPPLFLAEEQRRFVETQLPLICQRGGWTYGVCSAAPDHVHLLCDILPAVHGEKVRRLVKRWLSQALSEKWPLPDGATWWAEEGSNKAIHEEGYLNNAFAYIARQRTLVWTP